MNILIIEDEVLTANDLKRTLLQILPETKVLGTIGTVREGIALLEENVSIDLIFSDIQLSDGLSFEIFQAVQRPIPVIFCTAFDQYALKAFEVYGIDYILKPFDQEAVSKALQKYQHLTSPSNLQNFKALTEEIKAHLFPPKMPSSIIIQKRDSLIPVAVDDIALFYIKEEGVTALTFKQEEYQVNQHLESLEKSLSPMFFRANRQYLINRKAVKNASIFFNRKLLIHLIFPFDGQIIVGKRKVQAFHNWLSYQ